MSEKKFEVYCVKCGNVSIKEYPEGLLEITTFGACNVPLITDPKKISIIDTFNAQMLEFKQSVFIQLPKCEGKMQLREPRIIIKK